MHGLNLFGTHRICEGGYSPGIIAWKHPREHNWKNTSSPLRDFPKYRFSPFCENWEITGHFTRKVKNTNSCHFYIDDLDLLQSEDTAFILFRKSSPPETGEFPGKFPLRGNGKNSSAISSEGYKKIWNTRKPIVPGITNVHFCFFRDEAVFLIIRVNSLSPLLGISNLDLHSCI